VRVKVLEIDVARKRIGLSLRLTDEAKGRRNGNRDQPETRGSRPDRPDRPRAGTPDKQAPAPTGAMAEALRRAGLS
jgi:uncharacterized protein